MASQSAWQRTVTYGAVGGTQAADMMSFPPPGFRPFERRSRIGHGALRWDLAWQAVLTWELQRKSGFRVRLKETPVEVTDGTYTPVLFDNSGAPLPARVDDNEEVVYGAAGHTMIAPGDTAVLVSPRWLASVAAPCRVIYVIDEPNRKGFAYGTLPGHPLCGEEAFIVDQTEDGSVWFTLRSFSRPASWQWWLVYPALRFVQAIFSRRFFRSLSDSLD